MVRAAFPNGSALANARWEEPQSRRKRETDLVLLVGEFAVVLECKSGAVTPPARRGAPERLSRTLIDLIEEPSRQANQLIRFLRSCNTPIVLSNDRGERLTFDPAAIKYYIPISVTFEHLGAISSNMKKLVEAGIATLSPDEFAVSLSLPDLECVFDLLETQAEKIHYFARRREFERHVTYEADEENLLAFYLSTGFNIGSVEYEGRLILGLLGKAKELSPYFIRSGEGKPVPKPKPARTKWWTDLLTVLEARHRGGWLTAAYCLLNLTESDQKMFERNVFKLVKTIRSGRAEKKHNWVAFFSGPPERRFLVAGYPYTTQDKTLRNEMMATIINHGEAAEARGAVVIGMDLTKMQYPYDVFAGRLETNLFA